MNESTFQSNLERLVGTNVSAFSRKCGVYEGSIRKYLAGSYPSIEKAAAIADAAGMTLDQLFGRGHSFTTSAATAQQGVTQLQAHYGEGLPTEVRAAVEAQMPKVKAATAVAMGIAAHFGIPYMSRIVTELQTLAFFGVEEKHLTALMESIIENEPEIRAAAERRATPDRPEPAP